MKKVENLTEELFDLRKKISTTQQDNYKLQQNSLSNYGNGYPKQHQEHIDNLQHQQGQAQQQQQQQHVMSASVSRSNSLNLGFHGNQGLNSKKPPTGFKFRRASQLSCVARSLGSYSSLDVVS